MTSFVIDQQAMMVNHDEQITISLFYAHAPVDINDNGEIQGVSQHRKTLTINKETSLYSALEMAGWCEQFTEIRDWCHEVLAMTDGINTAPIAKNWRVGIYAQKQPLSYILKDKDRIEIYRPLSANPMKRRKLKARK